MTPALTPLAAGERLRGRRVLVTGGGFIGTRLAERLALGCGADVRVLVHRPASAQRLTHLPCRVIVGDVTDRSAVAAAVAGCDTVFHAAYGTSGSQRNRRFVTREGTRRVLAAAGAAGVRRVVHISTVMVYGRTADAELTEDHPYRRYGEPYSDSKLAAEQIAMAMARSGRSPVVVLQPANVYGPHSTVWGEHVLARLRTGRMPLIDGGVGCCNHVYVDDLVTALVLAASADDVVVGEAFLISSPEQVTWREFFAHFERMLGVERTESITRAEALRRWERAQAARPRLHRELATLWRGGRVTRSRLVQTREARSARRLAGEVLPERLQVAIKDRLLGPGPTTASAGGAATVEASATTAPTTHILTPTEIDFYTARTRVRIDKATQLLGFRPAVDLESGMATTSEWLRRASLLS